MPCKISRNSKKVVATNRKGKMEQREVQILTIEGELDNYTFPKFEKAVEEVINEKHPHVVLNGKNLKYISSTGIGTLAKLKETLEENGGDLRIAALPTHIVNILDALGFKEVLNLYKTEKEAIKSYKKD